MASIARIAYAMSALSATVSAFSPSFASPSCSGTTTSTYYETVTVQATASGMPYSPNNAFPEPVQWPGHPTKGQMAPEPRPTNPLPYGGSNAGAYEAPAWVPIGSNLTPALPQGDTNGNSKWGTFDCPHLPPFLPHPGTGPSSGPAGPSISYSTLETKTGKPYGTTSIPSKFISATSPPFVSSSVPASSSPAKGPCGTMPSTGVTRTYDFSLAYATIAPDGVQKSAILVNNQYPGPLIEANWGDWIQVTVTNFITNEGTTLHWHGLLQSGTPWYDGVPSVGQGPIIPGGTLTYLFRADQIGTSWYHSHFSAQYAGGAYGPIVIHGPKHVAYDIDIGPVLLADWFHKDYFTQVNETMNGIIPLSNNNLINGKMNYPCANTTLACTPNAGVSKFKFQSKKKHLLRLINTSAEGMQKFSIDGYNMTVIANDFVPINPYSTNVVTLGVGQRSDVIVEATGSSTDAVWMRASLGTKGVCSFTDGVSPEAVAAIYYEDADTSSVPKTKSSVSVGQLNNCANDPLSITTAFCSITPDPNPPTTQVVEMVFQSNGTNFVWFMNNSTFRGDYNEPVLYNANQGNLTFERQFNVYNFGGVSSVRMILRNHFPFAGAHPMHLHGHDFHVLSEGFGDWDGVVTNPSNTQRRDTQLLQAAKPDGTASFLVLQWTQDNPGVWPMHCHIAWHVSQGLYINVLERPDDIKKMRFPDSVLAGINAWDAYTTTNVPNQIDSGL